MQHWGRWTLDFYEKHNKCCVLCKGISFNVALEEVGGKIPLKVSIPREDCQWDDVRLCWKKSEREITADVEFLIGYINLFPGGMS